VGDDAQHFGAGLEALDDDDADVVLRVVHEQVGSGHGCCLREAGWPGEILAPSLI
jgi:hypothetical protein